VNSVATASRTDGRRWLIILALILAGLPVRRAFAAAAVDFSLQIRPLLADRCFKCHGPDDRTRKAKLRLDLAESAFAPRGQGSYAIVPGHPERSELWRRINAADEDERMPPLASKLSLTPEEKDLLRQWIQLGAEYKPHWSFIPVAAPRVPKLTDESRARNPVDAFVQTRLLEEGLRPAPEAARETLIRRLSFDLRGLPPALAEIDEFLADPAPNAYEKVVDKFLTAPAYGERQAVEWLDLARYADTYGYQADVERDLSPWRDWVIRAFNENLPYDQFVLWQLAGDLLPSPTRDQLLATAFNRLHRQTNEGGSIEEEFRAEYVADRVATAGTAFLGLTLGCARCHDHKFDPIAQKDFYRMSAFFNNIDESGLYSHFTRATPSPSLLLYPAAVEGRLRALRAQIQTQEAGIATLVRDARNRFRDWMSSSGARTIARPEPVAAFGFEAVKGNATADRMATNHFAALVDGPVQVEGKVGKGLKFSGDNSLVCKDAGAFNRTSPFSFSLWLKPTEKQERAVVFHRSRAWTDSGSRGYELVLEEGRAAFSLVHFWPGNALKVRERSPLPLNQWSHLAVTYDGSSRSAGVRLYLNGQVEEVEIVRDNLFKDIVHRPQWGDMEAGSIALTLAARFRDSGFKNGLIDEFEVFDCCLTAGEVATLTRSGTAEGPNNGAEAGRGINQASKSEDSDTLFNYYLERFDAAYQNALAGIRKLREEENQLVDEVPEIMVMEEMSPRRPTFVLKRGAYDAPGEAVEPGVPEKIFPFATNLPRNRLGLARWVVDPHNPLTSRVAVNRAWRMHFGRGLVVTEEDFGTQGKLPSNPALLNWLAWHFMETGWDVKALHKLLVMSATYRQSSIATPELLAKDPENQLLARGSEHRLRAEEIRDNALAVSGLLSPRIGGHSVKPYQPEGLWEQSGTGAHYTQDQGEGLYRRSLYTFWKRTAPPPSMLLFDAPSREVCTARRETTTTPLQALVLLNDPQFVEAARVLAERLVRQFHDDLDACIRNGFRLATGRAPQPREEQLLRRLYDEQLQLFAAEPGSASRYLKIGEHAVDGSLDPVQVAATAVLASAWFNLDEFITER
jgi:Protein of unknown function (DUF1553)/Protein of unknown function (DUF1549)/Concanavalin A-like lectin/glucanases superfamily/Planctomycete cytochrome C